MTGKLFLQNGAGGGIDGEFVQVDFSDVSNTPVLHVPQVSVLSGSGTYTTPVGALYLTVEMCGGGGGGAGVNTTSGGNGGTTTFGTSFLSAGGGTGADVNNPHIGGAGGAASGGDVNITGQTGYPTPVVWSTVAQNTTGGAGGNTPIFGGGGTGDATGSGTAATSPGGGGSGGSAGVGANINGRSGGGSGAYLRKLITSPLATYAYVVGAGGTAGTGTVDNGGAGAAGTIIVTAHFQ
jgi:hypothetical protein